MKITRKQLRRIIQEEKAKLREAFNPDDIDANMGTRFFLGDETGNLEVSGDLLDPAALCVPLQLLDWSVGRLPMVTGLRYHW